MRASLELLRRGAEELGLRLSPPQLQRFERYLEELRLWNRVVNLTALREEDEIVRGHFLDSLAVLPWVPARGRLLDLGSGAGLPGVPLKIARPELQVTLLEASRKKALFLRHLGRCLELDLEVRCQRAERPGDLEGAFDAVISRALGPLRRVAELGLPYLREGGTLLAMKGPRAREEVRELGGDGLQVELVPIGASCLQRERFLAIVRRRP